MAITYTYNDVHLVASQQFRRGVTDALWVYATNEAIAKMWLAYDWRGTVLPFAPFWLVPGQQDYGAPFYDVPSDFYGLREVYLVQIGANAIPVRMPLRVVENLEETHAVGFPQSITYRPSVKTLRLHPAAPYGASSPLYLIDGTYKTRPPKIQRSNASDLLLWDDVYFNVFVKALVLAVMEMNGDFKAAMEYRNVFMLALHEATAVENLEDREPIVNPNEALVHPNFSTFGWIPPL